MLDRLVRQDRFATRTLHPHVLARRRLMRVASGALGASLLPLSAMAQRSSDALDDAIRSAEAGLQARVGAFIRDTGAGLTWQHRAGEVFPMCSTFKLVAVGALLALVDRGQRDLSRRIVFGTDELVFHSPVTQGRADRLGITLAELCEATLATSDNTAANLMLRAVGGPRRLTRYLRAIGDPVTRLDRWETALNEARPGDPRDSTSPAAMVATMERLVIGDALSAASRAQLVQWLLGNRASDTKLKAGVPPGWRVADRTGAGCFGTNNVVGVVYPPRSAPILVGIFVTETSSSLADSNAAMARIARELVTTTAQPTRGSGS